MDVFVNCTGRFDPVDDLANALGVGHGQINLSLLATDKAQGQVDLVACAVGGICAALGFAVAYQSRIVCQVGQYIDHGHGMSALEGISLSVNGDSDIHGFAGAVQGVFNDLGMLSQDVLMDRFSSSLGGGSVVGGRSASGQNQRQQQERYNDFFIKPSVNS